ncbi:MAG: AMP-binding protein [Bdellovibrionales bacterium]|jgi:o-succinylbenzoate---CoA ligase|nr:AMP-binding protein [Bdellovibrionales bacterium]
MCPQLASLVSAISERGNAPLIHLISNQQSQQLSYAQIAPIVAQQVEQLKEHSLSKSSLVAIGDLDQHSMIITLLALWQLEAVPVLLPRNLPSTKIPPLQQSLGLSALITAKGVTTYSSPSPLKLPLTTGVVIFTSGTSGTPKGVVLTKSGLLLSANSTIDLYQIKPQDNWGVTLPLSHIGGLMILIRTLVAGSSLTITNSSATPLIEMLGKRILATNILSLVSTQLLRLLKDINSPQIEELKQYKSILLGGGPLAPQMIERATRIGLPISPTYGMSECCSQITALPPYHASSTANYSNQGPPLPHCQIKLGEGQEIMIQSQSLLTHYLVDGKLISPLSHGGSLATKDLGSIDGDGHLTVTGRSDLTFISGGENIDPQVIGQAMLEHPQIEWVEVKPKEHPEFGAVACATYGSNDLVDAEELRNFLRKRVPPFMIPKEFIHSNR